MPINSRLDFAKEQLDVSIELFLSARSYASALTLAGAAEEVFGQLLKLKEQSNALNSEYEINADVEQLLSGKSVNFKDFLDRKNKSRNALKHLDSLSEVNLEITSEIECDALKMIVRASDNFKRLGYEQSQVMLDLESWFYENIVGIC